MEPTFVQEARGTLRLIWPGPDVMCTVIDGHCSIAFVESHIREASSAYERGKHVHHFFDVEGLKTYDSEARIRLTDFAIKNRKLVSAAVFLLPRQNRLVTMGVTTAALAARLVGLEFEVMYDRAEFEDRMQRTLALARPDRARSHERR